MTISADALKKRILSDKYNAIVFGTGANSDIYLVGGYLRDVLLGRESLDRDYVASERFDAILASVTSKVRVRAVQIGRKGLYRFVIGDGISLDFSRLTGDIEGDVSARDFTINSMAWSPKRGIIDIFGGMKDLSNETIRMISAKNIIKDPVRIIRAYRLAAVLSFTIDRKTKNTLKVLNGLLKEAKTERITLEFFKMLNSENPSKTLRMLWRDGILECIIDCPHDELGHKVKVFSRINRMFKRLPLKYQLHMHDVFCQNLSYKGMLRLEILLRELPISMLALGCKVVKRLRDLHTADELLGTRQIASKDILFDIFSRTEEGAPDFLITRGFPKFLAEYDRYRDLKRRRFLSAEEIKTILKITDGAILGKLIRSLRKAEFSGAIKDKKGAAAFVKRELLLT